MTDPLRREAEALDFKRGQKHTIETLLSLIEYYPDTGCWLFTGAISGPGYGRVIFNGKAQQVHRIIYEHFRGPIQPLLVLDHLCRVPPCTNPWHTEAVTERVNALRGVGPTAKNAKKTHCPKGHEYSEENTYRPKWQPNWRVCLTCQRARLLGKWGRTMEARANQRAKEWEA